MILCLHSNSCRQVDLTQYSGVIVFIYRCFLVAMEQRKLYSQYDLMFFLFWLKKMVLSSNTMIPCRLIFLCFCIISTISSHAISANQAPSRSQTITSSDTISLNRTLSGNQTIVSSGGRFELGFFSPGNSNKHYIGIWFKQIKEQTVVWVANRETPISDRNSAQLKISNGNLVLFNESQSKIWSTDLNSTNHSVVAILLDDANLVLRNGSGPNSSNFSGNLWESFDHPTDTLMPGAKFGYNKRTHKNHALTSWKNSQDPAPGLFSRERDPNMSRYISLWNRSGIYWTSGLWNGRTFDFMPDTFGFLTADSNNIHTINIYIDNENESFAIYKYDQPLMARTVMDVSGKLEAWWYIGTRWTLVYSQPNQQCDVYAVCGPFGTCKQNSVPFCSCLPGFKVKSDIDWSLNDFSSGCVREIDLQCENNGSISNSSSSSSNGRSKDKFLMNRIVSFPENSQSMMLGSRGECESSCLSNCSCTAYAYDRNMCFLWNGELLNLQQLDRGDGNGRNVYIRLSALSSVFHRVDNDKGVVIGATLGCFAFVSVFVAVVITVVWVRNRRLRVSREAMQGSLVNFGFKELQNATKNFSIKLGGGGFGCVFKGVLPDSTTIAVKKLESIGQGEKQFRAEVQTIGIIQHVNLVRLRGLCVKRSKKFLVYDYMGNGSLDSHLFKGSNVLKWETRYQIALGVARGLEYLHEKCRDCIIHCDVKPENILLDFNFCPKVGDFGLAKLVGRDFSRVLTTIRGTLGYLAPEWIAGVEITAKADVYSYGMMLFELVSGKRNSSKLDDDDDDENMKYFFPISASRAVIEGGDILGLLDPRLDGDASVDEVTKIGKVACWCIQSDEKVRPSMGLIVQILEGHMDINLPPFPRWLQVFGGNPECSVSSY